MEQKNSYRAGPDEKGRFGLYGGRFVAETLMPLILDLERHYEAAQKDSAFAAAIGRLANPIMSAVPARFILLSA